MQNRQVLLKSRPSGIPQAEHFELAESAIAGLRDGQILVRKLGLKAE